MYGLCGFLFSNCTDCTDFWLPCIFGNFKKTVNEIKYFIDPGLPVFKPACRGTSSALLCSRDRQDALPQEPSLLVLLHQPGDETDQGDTEGTLNVLNRLDCFFYKKNFNDLKTVLVCFY